MAPKKAAQRSLPRAAKSHSVTPGNYSRAAGSDKTVESVSPCIILTQLLPNGIESLRDADYENSS
jgi:hypothetical protein